MPNSEPYEGSFDTPIVNEQISNEKHSDQFIRPRNSDTKLLVLSATGFAADPEMEEMRSLLSAQQAHIDLLRHSHSLNPVAYGGESPNCLDQLYIYLIF
jgi:hypothetical protein